MFDINSLPIKNYVIIGSMALNCRYANDVDVICWSKDIDYDKINQQKNEGKEFIFSFMWQNKRIECLLIDNAQALQIIYNNFCLKEIYYPAHFPKIDDLSAYIIKAGHIKYNSRNWEKHIHDYHILKKIVNIKQYGNYNNQYTVMDMIKMHEKFCATFYNQKSYSLKNVTKSEFFNEKVTRYIEHDSLHELFKHTDEPLHKKMQPDPAYVYCDEGLWNNFSKIEKMACVLEESYVIASERFLIPDIIHDRLSNPSNAFKCALKMVCTNLTSGFFRDFAIENYYEIYNLHNKKYYELLDNIKDILTKPK